MVTWSSCNVIIIVLLTHNIILTLYHQDDRHITYYFSFSHVLLLLFALNDRSSLVRAQQIRRKADSHWHGSRRIPAVLVGCKDDTTREISTTEALSVAKELDCCYVETSAAEGYNCVLPFKTAVKMYSHMTYRASELSDSGDHSHKRSNSIISKCKTLLSPMNQFKRDLRDLSPARIQLKASNSDHVRRLSYSSNTHVDPVNITISTEG
jgi:hypothetical protein